MQSYRMRLVLLNIALLAGLFGFFLMTWRTEDEGALWFMKTASANEASCNCSPDVPLTSKVPTKNLALTERFDHPEQKIDLHMIVDKQTESFTCRNHTTSTNPGDYVTAPAIVHGYSCLMRNVLYHNGTWYLNSTEPIPDRLRTFARRSKETNRSISKNLRYYSGNVPLFEVTKKLQTSELHIIISRFQKHKYGHLIVDSAFPIFYLMHIHNRVTSNNTILIMDGGGKQTFDSVFSTLSIHDLLYNIDDVCGHNDVCLIPEMIVGSGGLGWWFDKRQLEERAAISTQLPSFAFKALSSRFGNWDVFSKNGTDKLTVVVVQRGNDRAVSNLPLISQKLSKTFGDVANVMFMEMELLTVHEQVSLFKAASIVIGVDGTAFENVVWMRNNACLILLSRSPAEANGEKFNHDWALYRYSRVMYYAPYARLWKSRGIAVENMFTHTDDLAAASMKTWPIERPVTVNWNEMEFTMYKCLEQLGYHGLQDGDSYFS